MSLKFTPDTASFTSTLALTGLGDGAVAVAQDFTSAGLFDIDTFHFASIQETPALTARAGRAGFTLTATVRP